MADYIPGKEPAQVAWLWNFARWLVADDCAKALAHGLTVEEACELYFSAMQATLAITNARAKRAAAHGARARKDDALDSALALARDLAQRIQHDPNTTDQDRADAGLTVPDHTPTPHDAYAVLAITPPIIQLDFSIRQQVTIHWGPNPQDERNNGKPAGVMGAEIQYHKGGVPAEEDDWRPLDTDTDSPYVHTISESAPTTYAYRARYLGKKLKHGPHGDPVVCTVSV